MIFALAIVQGVSGNNQLYDRGPSSFTIKTATAGAAGAGAFTIAGDVTLYVPAGTLFTVFGSTGNNATYTVKTSSFGGGDTTITPYEAVPDGTDDGTISKSGWTLLATLGTKYNIPDILTFVDKAFIVNGYETPYKFDGVAVTHITSSSGTVPGGAKHHALHQGFYWLWNLAAASGALDGPSSLRASDLNDPASYPAANQIFVDKDDGDVGSGMGQFTIAETGISPQTSMILFKTFSAYQMTGVFGSTSPAFAIQRVQSDMGCVAPRTIKFAPGFGLIRLAHRGFALFDGVTDKLISEEIRPLLFGSSAFTALSWGQIDTAYAVNVPNPPLYVCACPVDATGLTRVFCYDLVRRAWTVLEYATSIGCFEAIRHPGALPFVLMGDFNQGKVRLIFSGAPDDDGTAIDWLARPKPVSLPSPQQNGYYRRFIIKVANVVTGQTIDVSCIIGPGIPVRQVDKTLTLPSGVGTAPSQSEVDLTVDIGLIGTNLRSVISGSGPIVIRGVETHASPKPLSRPSMLV